MSTHPALSLMGHAALGLAETGRSVFPCVPLHKRPLTDNGFHDATTDRDQIMSWWTMWPTANIGTPTGTVFDVLDIDYKPHSNGFEHLTALHTNGLLDGWSRLIRTPSGGAHLYYVAGEPQRSWSIPTAGIDFRGTGGYVLASPSQVSGRSGRIAGYDVINNTGVTPPTRVDARAIRSFLQPDAHPSPTPSATEMVMDVPRSVTRISQWLSTRHEGSRNQSLFWASCRLAEHGLPYAHTHQALAPIALHLGLSETEIHATITSAFRHAHPRPALSSSRSALSPTLTSLPEALTLEGAVR